MKNRFLLFLIIFIPSVVLPQSITNSSIALSGISFTVKADNFPDTLSSIRLVIKGESYSKEIQLNLQNGTADTVVSVPSGGNYNLYINDKQYSSVRVLPGILSILPPLLAILLALLLRQVVVSLLFGIFVGTFFIHDYNLVTGLLKIIDTYIINALADPSHIKIIIFTFLFGGVVGLMSKSGGTRGIANIVTSFAKKRRSGMISTWFSGLIIFFDDYANSLIVGNLMRPITDRMKISREKLAFIVDATAAPVSSVVIISTWIGFEVGLIQEGLKIIGSSENAYEVFLQTIPYRFYPLAMLIFVFLVAWTQRDFGPMLKAERRAVMEGKLSREGSSAAKDLTETSEIFGNEDKAKWYNGIIPLFILIFGTAGALVYTGIAELASKGITNYGVQEIISNSDPYTSLLWSTFSACIVTAVLIIAQKIMSLSETVDAWFTGIRSMLLALIILTLAWTIGAITTEIRTADYIINLISDSVNPRMLPVIVFIVCALVSFATGTSWGTMAIMMPIVIPLGHSVAVLNGYAPVDATIILHGVISSVLAGAVFGDHCSPISDTTILSSMASGCDHMDHVRTQLPYAVVVALLGMALGDIPTAYGMSPYLSILFITIILILILYAMGKKPANSGLLEIAQ